MKNLAPLLQGNLRLTNAFYRRYPHSPARLRCVVQPLVPNA